MKTMNSKTVVGLFLNHFLPSRFEIQEKQSGKYKNLHRRPLEMSARSYVSAYDSVPPPAK